MPLLSGFTPCGLLELSGETSDAEHVYATLKAQMSPAFAIDDTTYEGCETYALAMQIAWARAIVKRVPREMHPLSCFDLLTTNEKDWGCVPTATDTLFQRQLRLAARKLLMRGSREEALVTDLTAAIGSGFLKVNKIAVGDEANYPTDPTTQGTFPLPALAPRFYRLTSSVAVTGLPVAVTVTAVNASAAPVIGDKLTIEPSIVGNAETVTVTDAPSTAAGFAAAPSFTATFTKAHSVGGWVMSAAPGWLSNRYQLQIVVTAAAGTDAESRRKVNNVCARHCRSVERWKIVTASSSTDVGPFVIGAGYNKIGATALGASAEPF